MATIIDDTKDDSYVSRPGQSEVPVVSDSKTSEGGYDNRDKADSDEQLKKDDTDAIDSSNIIEERTRGATKNYEEPSDELDIPNDGRSAVSGGMCTFTHAYHIDADVRLGPN